MVLSSPSVKQICVRCTPPRSNQLWSWRRDSKQFVEKRRRKKREKERKKERKEEKEEEAFPPLFSDLGGSRTGPTHFKR